MKVTGNRPSGPSQADDGRQNPLVQEPPTQPSSDKGNPFAWHVVWLVLGLVSGSAIIVWLGEYIYYNTKSSDAVPMISQTFAHRASVSLVLMIVSVLCYACFLILTLKTWPTKPARIPATGTDASPAVIVDAYGEEVDQGALVSVSSRTPNSPQQGVRLAAPEFAATQ
jgi:hypothetical protein